MDIGFAIFPTVIKCQHKQWCFMPTLLTPFQATKLVAMATSLTEVHQIFSHRNLFIDDVNATIRIRAPVVE